MIKRTARSRLFSPVLAVTFVLMGATWSHAQLTPGTDVNTSRKTNDDQECAIARNPANPNQVFTSCNTSTVGLFAARSTDGGATWIFTDAADRTIADGDAGQGPLACCDPTLAWDTFGNLYLSYLNSPVNGVTTLLSVDGGATFTTLAAFAGSVDQPTIVAANTTAAGAPVAVWVVWNQSGQMVARGAAVTGLNAVGAFNALQTIPGTAGCSFGDIAIAPSGVVVQACQNPTGGEGPATIRVNIDADGLGAGNFGAVINATTTNVGGFDFIPAQNSRSVDAEAGLAYDANPASPTFGRLYLVYTDETVAENNDLDIMVRFSDNNGSTWSAPIRVNDDPAAPIRSQFMPKISSDDSTGNIGICWHDARNSAANTAIQMFCTVAAPAVAGPVFLPNRQVSDGASTSNGAGIEFGDYAGLDYFQGILHPVWADTSNGTGDNPNATANFDALTDRVSGGPATPKLTVPGPIAFGESCATAAITKVLNVCNTGSANLDVTGITSSNPLFAVASPSSGFPVTISPDFCFPFQVTFNATTPGPKTGTLTVASNDPAAPTVPVNVSASVGQPRVVTMVADSGSFGQVCVGATAFRDLPVTINNGGSCPLLVTGITSSSPEFILPQVLAFPLSVAPGDTVVVPMRFQPTSAGNKSANITLSTNDPLTPAKVVAVTGVAPQSYVCDPPTFASLDAAVGPTWGSGTTGSYTVNASGHMLTPFGPARTFGFQGQGEYMYYPGRQEGQFDAGLLYRRNLVQFGLGPSFKAARLQSEGTTGTLSHVAATVDFLLPTIRFGAFGAKGLRDLDVVTLTETVGAGTPSPVTATEQVIHTVDQLGGMLQVPIVANVWVDGHLEFLKRHAPGASNTWGGAVRLSAIIFPNVAVTAQFGVNESLVGAANVGTFTVGITLGRWSRPADYSNPVNPLGTMMPRLHYEQFQRVR